MKWRSHYWAAQHQAVYHSRSTFMLKYFRAATSTSSSAVIPIICSLRESWRYYRKCCCRWTGSPTDFSFSDSLKLQVCSLCEGIDGHLTTCPKFKRWSIWQLILNKYRNQKKQGFQKSVSQKQVSKGKRVESSQSQSQHGGTLSQESVEMLTKMLKGFMVDDIHNVGRTTNTTNAIHHCTAGENEAAVERRTQGWIGQRYSGPIDEIFIAKWH